MVIRLRRVAGIMAVGLVTALACSDGSISNGTSTGGDRPPASGGSQGNGTGGDGSGTNPSTSGGTSQGSGGGTSTSGGSSSGGAGDPATGGSNTGGSSGDSCDYPDWQEGAEYSAGDIVRYPADGNYYIAEHDNPGYDPIISTWYWNPYTCSGDGTGTGGSSTGGSTGTGGSSTGGSTGTGGSSTGGSTGTGGSSTGGSTGTGGSSTGGNLCGVLTESVFNQIFPTQNRHAVYTYTGFLQATVTYPAFASSSNTTTCKRELAAFFANVAWETGRLRYAEQISKDRYCSSRSGCQCDASTSDQSRWYYGRGALQLSWNYNYCSAGAAYGENLLTNPGRVATEGRLAWGTALWFWMSNDGAGNRTCHEAMTVSGGFGETIRSINGVIECNKGGYNSNNSVKGRIDYYVQYCGILGVDPGGSVTDLDC